MAELDNVEVAVVELVGENVELSLVGAGIGGEFANDRLSSQVTQQWGGRPRIPVCCRKKTFVTNYANYVDIRQPRNLADFCPKLSPPQTIA